MQETQTVEVLEPPDQVTAVPTEEAPSKLSSFLLWRNTPSRFLPARSRSQSDQRSPHPLQATLHPSNSTPDLKIMAASIEEPPKQAEPQEAHVRSPTADGQLLQTPSDPRTPSSSSTISRNDSVLDTHHHHPDLHDEASKLNEKLINAINHQASLDETLQQTRNELDVARQLIAKLESDAKEAREKAEQNDERLMVELNAEKESRCKAEKEKKAMEAELEALTSALFIEANTMVSDARKEKEVSDKRIEQLRAQLQESETLRQSHQAQLTDLKTVLEQMRMDEAENAAQVLSDPSSPMLPLFENAAASRDGVASDQQESTTQDAQPDQPMNFNHLLKPVLRTDHSAYNDFASLIKQAITASPPSSRATSGNYSNLAAAGGVSPPVTGVSTPTVGAFPSMGLAASYVPRQSSSLVQQPILRDSKVFKKALVEDIEPALRLDVAPGISWMVRRPIVNSMIDGTLVVEPMPPSPVKGRGPVHQCSLCGENRIGEFYARKHRFRISEEPDSKRFPLCDLCLGRLRSCCELLSFLRTITGGHWKADSEDEIKSAWEEYVKLRERIFWHRMAGGVVPASYSAKESTANSARLSLDSAPPETAEETTAGPIAIDAENLEPIPSGGSEAFVTPVATPQLDIKKDPIAIVVETASQVSSPIEEPKHEILKGVNASEGATQVA